MWILVIKKKLSILKYMWEREREILKIEEKTYLQHPHFAQMHMQTSLIEVS